MQTRLIRLRQILSKCALTNLSNRLMMSQLSAPHQATTQYASSRLLSSSTCLGLALSYSLWASSNTNGAHIGLGKPWITLQRSFMMRLLCHLGRVHHFLEQLQLVWARETLQESSWICNQMTNSKNIKETLDSMKRLSIRKCGPFQKISEIKSVRQSLLRRFNLEKRLVSGN